MSDLPVDVLRRYCSAMESGPAKAVEACLDTMDQNIVLYAPTLAGPIPKVIRGKAHLRPLYEMLFGKMFKEFRWAQTEFYSTDDPEVAIVKAVAQVVLTTGKDYSNDYMLLCRVRAGKIVEQWEFMDGARAAAAFEGMG